VPGASEVRCVVTCPLKTFSRRMHVERSEEGNRRRGRTSVNKGFQETSNAVTRMCMGAAQSSVRGKEGGTWSLEYKEQG